MDFKELLKELDGKAKKNEIMPYVIPGYKMMYYQASRYLYRMYDMKKMSLEDCKKEKAEIIRQCKDEKMLYELFLRLIPLKEKLTRLKEEGFNSVLEWEILEDINEFLEL